MEETQAKQQKKKRKRPEWQEWLWAIFWAFLIALFTKSFLFEIYNIPSQSMESTIVPGDYIFVNKLKYGPRLPFTPIAFPFAHSEIPVLGNKSYSEKWTLPYTRLPGFSSVQKGDVVLFNYPMGIEPVDRRQNYIKRCVATPGDTLEIVNGRILVNGELLLFPEEGQYDYNIITNGKRLDREWMGEWGVSEGGPRRNLPNHFKYALPEKIIDSLKSQDYIKTVERANLDKGIIPPYEKMFPNDPGNFPWNRDNIGPLILPSKGDSVHLSSENVALYRKMLALHETPKEEQDSIALSTEEFKKILIKREGETDSLIVIQKNYYFMMGDNRHQSSDSRYWGFVPEDHIVGRASYVLFSIKPLHRWYHSEAFESNRWLKGL